MLSKSRNIYVLWLEHRLHESPDRGQPDGRQDQDHEQEVAEHLQYTQG